MFGILYTSPKVLPPVDKYLFESEEWMASRRNSFLYRVRDDDDLLRYPHAQTLAMMVRLVMNRRSSVRLLDFGGGIGNAYAIASSLLEDHEMKSLAYIVVDNAINCEIGRDLFFEHGAVSFVDDLSFATKAQDRIDILFASSVMQYCLDYEATMHALGRIGSEYILVSRHMCLEAVEQVAYSIQRVHMGNVYWGSAHIVMIPVKVLQELLGPYGYRLVSKTIIDEPGMGVFQPPHDKYLVTHRSLLFRRDAS